MSIVHALFVPKGSIGKSGFIIAAAILIAVGVLQSVVPLAVPALQPVMFFIGLVVAYCWVALWIKRFHEAGTSGWWTVLVVFVWLLLSMIVGFVVMLSSGLDPSIFAGGDQARIQAEMAEATQAAAIPNIIAGVLVSAVVAFGLNAILPVGKSANRDGGAGPDDAPEAA